MRHDNTPVFLIVSVSHLCILSADGGIVAIFVSGVEPGKSGGLSLDLVPSGVLVSKQGEYSGQRQETERAVKPHGEVITVICLAIFQGPERYLEMHRSTRHPVSGINGTKLPGN